MAASITATNDGMAEFAKLIGLGLGGTQFGAMALGSNSTAATAADRRLGNEFDNSIGLGRKTIASATKTLRDSGVGWNNTMRYVNSWGISGVGNIREYCLANSDTADVTNSGNPSGGAPTAGITAIRGVFNLDFTTQGGDSFTLTIDDVVDDKTVDMSGAPSQTLQRAGMTRMLALIQAGSTPTRFGFQAFDDTARTCLDTHTALASEFTTLGLSRAASTVTNQTTVVTNDTTRFSLLANVTGNATVDGIAVFDASSAGTMLCEFQFASVLNLANTDQYTQAINIVQVTS